MIRFLSVLLMILPGLAIAADLAPATRLKELEGQLKQTQAEHEQIKKRADLAAEELESIRSDMVSAARGVQEHEESLSDLELQLNDLAAVEKEKSAALDRKRQQMNGVLTALLRLSFRPSEALVAQPTSPADTVRSAILLRGLLPQINEEAHRLKADIQSLVSLRSDIAGQKRKISAVTVKLDAEHRRLTQLYQRQQQVQQKTESERLDAERRMQTIAAEAEDLRDLLVRIETERRRREAEAAEKAATEKAAAKAAHDAEVAAAKAAREAEIAAVKAARERHDAELAAQKAAHQAELEAERQARKADQDAQKAAQEAKAKADQTAREAAAASARAAAQPPPAARPSGRPFAQAHGEMPFPARGKIVMRFGQTTELGQPSKGLGIETRPGAQVVAPYDGQVVFSGPFRGYGLLLIIEHGEGYHTLLAGVARLDAAVGQHLLAGEPIGIMGQPESRPLLYVELRHNGQPVNPLPWLTARKTKVSG
ncbi:MAG TPA: peptidoglycan DD-metalloendopeptidase family protein [Rhodospirillaceae bacterium]|nr:peptidoglycan DD-metalloendopeptidase family protein [Rhodospirillaceae bacterium]